MADAISWVKWYAGKWLVGTSELDRTTEFVFFRLCQFAYEAADPLVQGSPMRNAMRCKSTAEEYQNSVALLVELEKIEVTEEGVFIPSVARRLADANTAIAGRQIGAAKSRRRRELSKEGLKSGEIDLIIKDEFPDDQSDDQAPKREEKRETERKIDREEKKETLFGEMPEANEVDLAFSAYNDFAVNHSLPRAQILTQARKSRLGARLKECGGLEGWKFALSQIEKSDFLLGKKTDFKADLDFVLQASSFTKLMEGSYSNSGQKVAFKANLGSTVDGVK